jgi:hypothetical protein
VVEGEVAERVAEGEEGDEGRGGPLLIAGFERGSRLQIAQAVAVVEGRMGDPYRGQLALERGPLASALELDEAIRPGLDRRLVHGRG